MDFKERPINQSLIHRFLYKGEERENICPKKIYHIDIIESHHYRTESMLKGSFFETLCLGKGAGGMITDDLPRKRLKKSMELENIKRRRAGILELKGEKTTDQERIEEQSRQFKILANKYQITVSDLNTQVKIVIPWHKNPEIYLGMELDIFPTAIMTNEGPKMAIIDLKLTYDINNTYGEFCWGAPEFMDLNQAYMYSYGVRHIYENIEMNMHLKDLLTKPAINLINNGQIDFYYWIFAYKKMEQKLIKITWDDIKEKELHESIRKTVSLIEFYEQQEWPAKPDYKICKECTVFECPKRQTIQSL